MQVLPSSSRVKVPASPRSMAKSFYTFESRHKVFLKKITTKIMKIFLQSLPYYFYQIFRFPPTVLMLKTPLQPCLPTKPNKIRSSPCASNRNFQRYFRSLWFQTRGQSRPVGCRGGYQPVFVLKVAHRNLDLHKMPGNTKTYSPKWWFHGDLP